METFSALLAICAGNSPAPDDFPAQRPVTRSFDVFFDLYPNTRLSKQSWGWLFAIHRAHNDVIVMWSTEPLVPNFNIISIKHKMQIKLSYAKYPPYCSDLM